MSNEQTIKFIRALIKYYGITGAVKIVDRDGVSSVNIENSGVEIFGTNAGIYSCYTYLKGCHFETLQKHNITQNLKRELKRVEA